MMVTARTRWTISLAAVVLACIVTAGVSILLSVHFENASQSAQRRAGQSVEAKLCQDIGTMAALQPPAGNASANPSRAYEQAEHTAWAGLYQAIGCKETQ